MMQLHPETDRYIDLMIAEMRKNNVNLTSLADKMKETNLELEVKIIEENTEVTEVNGLEHNEID